MCLHLQEDRLRLLETLSRFRSFLIWLFFIILFDLANAGLFCLYFFLSCMVNSVILFDLDVSFDGESSSHLIVFLALEWLCFKVLIFVDNIRTLSML